MPKENLMDYSMQKFGRHGRVITAWDTPLEMTALEAEVPSLFTTQAHGSRTAKYSFIPTAPLIERLVGEGFYPVEVRAGYSRDYNRMPYVKHLIRLRPTSYLVRPFAQAHDAYPEVILLNSHDGTTGFKLLAGWFRLICLNGLVVDDQEFPSLEVPHRGDTTAVIEAAYRIVDSFPAQVARIEDFRAKELEQAEQHAFAAHAAALRWGDGQISPLALLRVRRQQDEGDSLWHVFNRVQENLLKGGIEAVTAGGSRVRKSRAVRAISSTLSLNQSLWALATRYLNN
jgi:Domain of unknown function (DUF932)